jgi:proteasome beta subunit
MTIGDGFGVNPSFIDYIRATRPDALPSLGAPQTEVSVPHGTTVLGLRFDAGVIMAGDRQATEGYTIADDRMEKVFETDPSSAMAISGAAGQAVEMVRLFKLEIEHYEKITGEELSLEGRSNRLAQFIRQNLPMAYQGLVVVPLFGGFDQTTGEGRLFRYDATGGRWEEATFETTGSGGRAAKGSLKKLWKPEMQRDEGIAVAVRALADAAEEDIGTGGPSLIRAIFPTVLVITTDGVHKMSDEELRPVVTAVLEGGAS